MKLLTCNVGSSSLRLVAFTVENDGTLTIVYAFHGAADQATEQLQAARAYGPYDAIAHRIVHGGRYSLMRPMLLDVSVTAEIERFSHLAPDHNPPALRVAEECRIALGNTPQFAVFDSAFHSTLPERAWRYPISRRVSESYGIRRLGFHGLSHAYSSKRILGAMSSPRPLRHVSVHAGNGVSAAAILNGVSVDTTMGFTPLEGTMMGTRSGSIDPGILLELQSNGMSLETVRTLVDRESGLLGISNTSAEYGAVAAKAVDDAACALAIEMYHHRLAGEVARMAAALGGVDVLSFTGGVGEHYPAFRDNVSARLNFLTIASVLVVESREDEMLAEAVAPFVTPAHAPA